MGGLARLMGERPILPTRRFRLSLGPTARWPKDQATTRRNRRGVATPRGVRPATTRTQRTVQGPETRWGAGRAGRTRPCVRRVQAIPVEREYPARPCSELTLARRGVAGTPKRADGQVSAARAGRVEEDMRAESAALVASRAHRDRDRRHAGQEEAERRCGLARRDGPPIAPALLASRRGRPSFTRFFGFFGMGVDSSLSHSHTPGTPRPALVPEPERRLAAGPDQVPRGRPSLGARRRLAGLPGPPAAT